MLRIACVLALAACGGKAATSSTTTPPTTPANDEAVSNTEPTAAPVTADGPPDTAQCENRPDMFGPFALTAEQAAARYGHGAATITDALSTKQRAIEVCGIPASRAWMQSVTCAGGEPTKVLGRTGSVGPGGRCGAIIDLYEVQCPEKTYEVFIDIYQCGPGESM